MFNIARSARISVMLVLSLMAVACTSPTGLVVTELPEVAAIRECKEMLRSADLRTAADSAEVLATIRPSFGARGKPCSDWVVNDGVIVP